MPRTISCPYSGCSSITRRSSGVSGPSLRSTRVGTPSLPTSCRIPANRRTSRRPWSMPSSRAMRTEARPTRSLCPRVYVSLMSTACTRALMVARWAACSRWYWAKTQQEMYIGSRTMSADSGPYGPRHRTAIISPASPCTRCGPSERAGSPLQARRTGSRSAATRIEPSSAVRTRLNTRAAAQAGSSAYGRSGSRSEPLPAAPRVTVPPSRPWTDEAARTVTASCAARQTRRAVAGGVSTRPASEPGIATRAAAAGGSRKAAASSSGKNDPARIGTELPKKGQRPGSSQTR